MSIIDDKTCRICLSPNSAFINILSTFHNRSVQEIIENLVRIKFDEFLQAPRFICQLCLSKLLQAESIIELCRKNHEFLTELSQIEEEPPLEVIEVAMEPEPSTSTFFCSSCGLEFDTKHKLIYHERTKHETTKIPSTSFSCDRCGRSFKLKSHIRNHMNVVHLKIKRFHCHICGFKMYSKTHYTTHLRTHSNVKEFTCPQCGKAFARKSTLDTHVKTHTGQRDYVCKFCSKSYTAHTDLKKHLSQHTNRKPYHCNLCDDGFVLKRQLFEHIKFKHPGQDTTSWLNGKTNWSELMR